MNGFFENDAAANLSRRLCNTIGICASLSTFLVVCAEAVREELLILNGRALLWVRPLVTQVLRVTQQVQ